MKNKKIISISMVKDEMDIIESFVRYNLNIFDGMIILDNGSRDETLKILRLLENEGIELFVLEDNDKDFSQVDKMNMLLLKAVNEFNPDIVVPLDADEFLTSSNNENPRKILEKISSNTYLKVKWKTYVPDFSKNQNIKFIPLKITFIRDNSLDNHYKVIVPRELVEYYSVRLNKGSHSLLYDLKFKDLINATFSTELYVAHFPIRSKEQAMSKIVNGWIYTLSDNKRKEYESWHRKEMFNKLKEKGQIEEEDVINLAKKYALKDKIDEIEVIEDPLNLNFCKDIKIKYTNETINPIKNILENYELLSLSYLNLKKDSLIEINKLKNQNNYLKDEKISNEKKLNQKINEYENSNSWKITLPLRYITNKLRNLKEK